jgi:hypothetical protein
MGRETVVSCKLVATQRISSRLLGKLPFKAKAIEALACFALCLENDFQVFPIKGYLEFFEDTGPA